VASLSITFPSETTLTAINRRTTDDLPAHIKGSTEWDTIVGQTGYYIPRHYFQNKCPGPIEFINNAWYSLIYLNSEHTFCTSNWISRINNYNLGYWNLTDPEHPDYQAPTAPKPITVDPPTNADQLSSYGPQVSDDIELALHPASRTSFCAPLDSDSSASEGTSTMSACSYQSVHKPNSPAIPDPTPSIDTLVASINPIVSLQGTLPLDPPNMSVNNTTTNAPSGGFKGIALNIIMGDRSHLDAFWNKFRHH
jgi:hypothetical protein